MEKVELKVETNLKEVEQKVAKIRELLSQVDILIRELAAIGVSIKVY